MILWELDNNLGVWIEKVIFTKITYNVFLNNITYNFVIKCFSKVRVGEVGGNSLGFLGSGFSPDGMSIIAHGFQGSFHLWHFDSVSCAFIFIERH